MRANFSAVDFQRRKTTTSKKSDPIVESSRVATLKVASPPPLDMFFHATLARAFIQSLHLHGDDDFVDR